MAASARNKSARCACSPATLLITRYTLLQVAEGYRRPLPEHWPQQLAELVTECMAQEPRDRPTAAQVRC